MKLKTLLARIVAGMGIVAFLACGSRSDDPNQKATTAATARDGQKAGQIRDDNELKLKLIWCPPGKFVMGYRDVDVTLSTGFWLGQIEVTQSEWKTIMRSTPWISRKSN